MTEQAIGSRNDIPAYHELFNPVLDAVRQLGGSGSNSEIEEQIIANLNFREDILEFHKQDSGQPTLRARLSWAKDYLKRTGYLESTKRGVWGLTNLGRDTQGVDSLEIRRLVRSQSTKNREAQTFSKDLVELEPEESDADVQTWRTELLEILRTMSPADFEGLCQLMLRESGLYDVELTPAGGDRGIDGFGLMRIGDLFSFRMAFQCKRYEGSVAPSIIRDFRGSFAGRAERGLIVTTGRFSREARREASRDGADTVDLMDGEDLMVRLEALSLGVETVQRTIVNRAWWESNYSESV